MPDGGLRGQVRRHLRLHQRQGRRELGRSVLAAGGDAYFAVQHRGAGGGIAERGHGERVLGRQCRERRQQAGVYLTRMELRGVLRGEVDPVVPEQLRARAHPGGQIRPQCGVIGGGAAGLGRADVDPGAARAEARDHGGRVPGQLAVGRRRSHHDGGALRVRRSGLQRHQPARADPLRLQHRAQRGIAGDDRVATQLVSDPGRSRGLRQAGRSGGRVRDGLGRRGCACRPRPGGRSRGAGEDPAERQSRHRDDRGDRDRGDRLPAPGAQHPQLDRGGQDPRPGWLGHRGPSWLGGAFHGVTSRLRCSVRCAPRA